MLSSFSTNADQFILAELEAKLDEDAISHEEGELEAQLSCLQIEELEEDWEDV